MLSGLDHVTIAVRGCAEASEQYEALLGAPPVFRGHHPGLGTRAALFALANGAIELVGPDGDAPEAEGLRDLLDQRGESIQALAFACDDAGAFSKALRERGLRATPPQEGEARGEDGSVRTFRTVELSPRATRGLSVFAVERPERAFLKTSNAPSPDAAEAIDHVVIRTSDPDAAIALYKDALGLRLALDAEIAGRRMLFFRTGGVTLEVVHDPNVGEQDAFWGIAYRVRDLEAAHARLTGRGLLLSEPRLGLKPNTRVFTVKSGTASVPTLILRDPARD